MYSYKNYVYLPSSITGIVYFLIIYFLKESAKNVYQGNLTTPSHKEWIREKLKTLKNIKELL